MHPMSKRVWAGLTGLLVLAVMTLVIYQRWWLGPEIVVHTATVGTIVQTIVASGHVQSPHRIDVSAQITASVASVSVNEGQHVQKGQLLLTLEHSEAKAGLQQSLASVAQAQTHLRQLQEVSEPVAAQAQTQAQANLLSAENSLTRTQQLYDKAFVGASAKEEAQRQVSLARSQLLITQHQWRNVQANGSEIANAQAALQQAHSNVDLAQARLAYTRIVAPRSGVLIARNVEAGDGVQAGKVLLVLSPDGVTELVVQIDEKNLKWVRLGQPALFSADAFADQVFNAEVVFINPGVDPLRGSVEVKLKVLDAPAFLTQDMTVSVDIEVNRREAALQIPLTSVHIADKASTWVLTIIGKHATRVPVILGLQSKYTAEVLAGLQAGDSVIPVTEVAIHAGSRVRVKQP